MTTIRLLPFAILVLVAQTAGASMAAAADSAVSAVTIERIDVGLGGVYKLGRWTPIRVTLSSPQDHSNLRLMAVTTDGDGVATEFVQREMQVRLSAGIPATFECYARFGRLRPTVTVRVLSGDIALVEDTLTSAELPKPLLSTQPLILELGESVGVPEAVRRARVKRSHQITVCQLSDPAILPTAWYGYEGVDTIVAATSRDCLLEMLDESQFEALVRWLRLGGRMVLSVGRRGAELFGPENRLAIFAPGSDPQVIALRSTSGLVDYARATERLDAQGDRQTQRAGVPITSLKNVRGAIECSELGGAEGHVATIVRTPFALGQIVLLAFDVDRAPLADWKGRPGLLARVLQFRVGGRSSDDQPDSRAHRVTHLGYEDLIGQLRAALDQFQGVMQVPFSWVAGLVALYIVLIGPVDYFLLRKLGRMHWTWVTFPLITIGFCVLAYLLATRLSADRTQINIAELVDVDVESSVARGLAWSHLYSPTARDFDLAYDPQPPWPPDARINRQASLLAWQGLPGQGLGGLNAPSTVSLLDRPYRVLLPAASQDSVGAVRGVPVPASGSKSLAGIWWAEGRLEDRSDLTVDANGLLTGSLINPLDVSLSGCSVAFENWIYPLRGSVQPGQRISFSGIAPRNHEWHLSRRRVVETEDVGTPWDQTSLDVWRILEILMFYGSAGGKAYTGMTHQYQPYVDLSDHLRCGRAILIGRVTKPVGRLHLGGELPKDGYDRQWTIYRVIFPVASSG